MEFKSRNLKALELQNERGAPPLSVFEFPPVPLGEVLRDGAAVDLVWLGGLTAPGAGRRVSRRDADRSPVSKTMIRDLLLKETHDHLLSLRFQVGLALALVLVSVSAFVLSTQYQRERADYERRLSQEDAFLRQYAHVNRLRHGRPPAGARRRPR